MRPTADRIDVNHGSVDRQQQLHLDIVPLPDMDRLALDAEAKPRTFIRGSDDRPLDGELG